MITPGGFMIQKILARVGLSLMLTACGVQNSDVGQEALNAGGSPPVTAPSDPGLPNGSIKMTSPAAESRISIAGSIPLNISITDDAGITDVEFYLGEYRVYLQFGLKSLRVLEINKTISLLQCGTTYVSPGP